MLHDEVLTESGGEVLRTLGPVAEALGFHLGGGTAVAVHLGHRRSIDFDWFSPSPELDPHELAGELRERAVDFRTEQVGHGALHGAVSGINVTFLRYRYPLLGEPLPWERYGCRVASLEDLACTKLAAATQRGAKKDLFDVAAICSARIPLEQALALYRRKFDLDDVGHVLISLTYFDQADREPDPELLSSPPWEEVRGTLRTWVRDLTRPGER